jgi:hypothetical protein
MIVDVFRTDIGVRWWFGRLTIEAHVVDCLYGDDGGLIALLVGQFKKSQRSTGLRVQVSLKL